MAKHQRQVGVGKEALAIVVSNDNGVVQQSPYEHVYTPEDEEFQSYTELLKGFFEKITRWKDILGNYQPDRQQPYRAFDVVSNPHGSYIAPHPYIKDEPQDRVLTVYSGSRSNIPEIAFCDEMLTVIPEQVGRQLLVDLEDNQPLKRIDIEVSTQLADRVSDKSAQALQIKTERLDINREGEYSNYRHAIYNYFLGNKILKVSHQIDWYDAMTDEMATSLINTIDELIPNALTATPQPERPASKERSKRKALPSGRRTRPPGR